MQGLLDDVVVFLDSPVGGDFDGSVVPGDFGSAVAGQALSRF